MDDRNDRKRDRLSWAEVDKLRDQSRNRERDPMQKQSSPVALNAQRTYRAALERAFASGKLGELARTLQKTEDIRPPVPNQPMPVAAAPPSVVDGEGAAAPAPAAPPAAAPPPTTPTPATMTRDPDREQKQKLLGKIRDAEGREAVTRAVDAFLGKYGKLPDDVEILTRCLGHRSDERVLVTLEQLTVLIERDKPRRARTLVAQLRMLEDTHGDAEIRTQAGKVRARL